MEHLEQHKKQITKFGFYGLLKNLRFFEPYIIIYFLLADLNLFHIGLLFSIREIIIYLFEIPSGVIADRYGKKTELVICFFFYLASFLMFFFATEFYMFALAMGLYALGEAFRSGTHKSMIMAYIDRHEIKVSKTKIYGLTRSYSLIGSMIASIVSIGLILWLPEIKYLFLIAMIPYTLDLLLVLSYPNYLNDRKDVKFSYGSFLKHSLEGIKYTLTKGKVRGAILNSASYQATFKSIKDYIQPILITVSLTFVLFSSLSEDDNTKVYIGLIYAVIYLISAISSKNAYKVKRFGHTQRIISFMWFLTGLSMIALSIFINSIWVVFVVFLSLYIMMNIRRPLMVETIGDVSDPDKRATVLSVESQMTSLLIAIFAPLIGLLAEYSMSLLFMSFGIFMFFIFIVSILNEKKNVKNNTVI
ncbi:MFS transporter [Mariniplasma anaerobium]|uniref:MFS transporter n=1 Tax=Mariniplasma anaerobium TaxID=2735436 RepID=A0A7U9THL5_9MOLU|nr:MFS transporter [Mariniplasma anaerobium]BCR36628.1 MFS transporter [Mariniplasma anaerobium]